NVPVLDRTELGSAEGTAKGGYVLAEASGGTPEAILIATGSEVAIALAARERLEAEGTPTRVVSMPCVEWFRAQDAEYRQSVLPRGAGAPPRRERYRPIRGTSEKSMTNPGSELSGEGVAVWLDDISRDRLRTGNLRSLIAERSVVGVTSNPTIFEKALNEG